MYITPSYHRNNTVLDDGYHYTLSLTIHTCIHELASFLNKQRLNGIV